MGLEETNRRTVLTGIGAGLAGSALLSGAAAAGDTGDERRQDSFTWALDAVYEMLEAEALIKEDEELVNPDAEGDESSHRPIWVVGAQDNPHSPHVGPPILPFGVDHVIGLEPGKKFFSAQWHVHAVIPAGDTFPAVPAATGKDGEPLTSKAAIKRAVDEGLVQVIPLVDPATGEPDVFTCPVRPHQHK